jgi:hypothetical protein
MAAIDAAHARTCAAQRELLALIADADRGAIWRDSGARDTAHWLSIRFGLSWWKAHRWIAAAHALETLPRLADALSAGVLGVDKVVEVCRFATLETEARLIRWGPRSRARRSATAPISPREPPIEDVIEVERSRFASWWYHDDGRRFGLEADLPAAQGAVVARALERMVESIPAMPGEEDDGSMPARRADALVAVCSARIGRDADPDRGTVVVHARLEGLASGDGGCEIEGGPVVHPETVRRLLCNARVQTLLEDETGNVVGLGRPSRDPPAWMLRQVRYRDRECRFPGCGARRFTEAHHLVWWRHGGRTALDNLLLICSFHHRLVHEHGWSVMREANGALIWHRPDGARYQAGPSPGVDDVLLVADTA